jgi:hypothetical protein
MKTYIISCTKGTREVVGTYHDAIKAAKAMEKRLQPSYGVSIEMDDETIAEVRDGVVVR